MSLTTNNKVKIVAPSVTSLLPEGHYKYAGEEAPTYIRTKKAFHLPQSFVTTFRRLGAGMKIVVGTLFFLLCLAIPTTAAAAVFNMTATSDPIETMRTQEVPSSGQVEQHRKGIQIDISWVSD